MRISRIYSPEKIAWPAERSASVELQLGERTAHYLAHVLRRKPGDELVVFDGSGGEYAARITELKRKQATVELLALDDADRASPVNITLGLGIVRGDRMDSSIRKACELGVCTIQPLLCERSEQRLKKAALEKRMAHWQGIIVSACEQSGLNRLPELADPISAADWCRNETANSKLLLHPGAKPLTAQSLAAMDRNKGFAIAIGPEGGFSDQELSCFESAGFTACGLGPRVLRAETAPLAMLSIVQFVCGDLGAKQ